MSRISVKLRLVLALSVILLVSFVVVSLVNYRMSRESVRDEIFHTGLPLTRDTIHSELKGDFLRPLLVSSLMAGDTFLRDWTLGGETRLERVQRYLRSIRDRYGFFTAFFVSDISRNYYRHSGVAKRVSRMDLHDVWYYEFVARGVESDLDVDTDETTGELTLFINYRVEDYTGGLLGVAGVGLSMDRFAELISSYQDKYKRRIYLVDPFGRIQLHSNTEMADNASIRELPGVREIASDILALRGDPALFEYEGENGPVLVTARHLDEIGWTLMVEQDEGQAMQTVRSNLVRTLAVGGAAWLVVVAVSVLAVNHFQRRLVTMAATDQLTGAANRWELKNRFQRALSRRDRSGTPVSLIMLDLDNFKTVNDRLGHQEGDRVLMAVAELVRGIVRPGDVLARWGGDEFLVLAEASENEAVGLANRIRGAVNGRALGGGDGHDPVSVSCGVAEYRAGETLDGLVHRADQAVYHVKRSGRDDVAVSEC